jgi:glucose-6-phosphate isomerase
LHQGPHIIPVDFILVCLNHNNIEHHQDVLIGSALSQSQALMCGKSYTEAYAELQKAGFSENECNLLARHKSTPGNRPSNTLLLKNMMPKNLGALIALYEHKTFVQGVIWQVNSFDQWGVELGKKLLPNILHAFKSSESLQSYFNDSSTLGLIEYYKNLRGCS